MIDVADTGSTARLAGVDIWEDPPRQPHSRGDAPVLAVDGFQGPLDGLLDMARARQIDLARLSIAALIEAFETTLQTALAGREGARIGHWAAWIVMAASLAELWSKRMLPADSPEARAALAEAEALRRAFADRARLQAAADWLERRSQLGRDVFSRGRPEAPSARRFGDLTDLLRACLLALRVPGQGDTAADARPLRFWTVAEAIGRLREGLENTPDGAAFDRFLPPVADGPARELRCKAAVASTLIAGLELARTGDVAVKQDSAFAGITMKQATPPSSTPGPRGSAPPTCQLAESFVPYQDGDEPRPASAGTLAAVRPGWPGRGSDQASRRYQARG